MAETLTEKVARAIEAEIYDCPDLYAPGVKEAARAAIAVMIEEAAKVCFNEYATDWNDPRTLRQLIAAATRRLAE